MDDLGGIACVEPTPVSHLSIDGRPALTPEITPSILVMICRLLIVSRVFFDSLVFV
ncbi:hypothetical protein Bca4012_035831 [Brassica carinata]|uniref:Uncharacterized protein n=1 Tax=Brassica carinata TaxID=52824 RepID=A0A8X7WBK6_BRACI|nr:hypothetical protein Bca52824_009644 [Brassica carinata]